MATETATKPGGKSLRGAELLRAAVNQIIEHPETWIPHEWHCGTTQPGNVHCLARWCQILGALRENVNPNEVRELLGVSVEDANWLWSPRRTLSDLRYYAKETLAGRAVFDSYGLGRDGFDRDGFDIRGLDANGRDRGGFGSDYGYDGYDCHGFDRDGYNRAGRGRGGDKLPPL
jgi:hypothetical protein